MSVNSLVLKGKISEIIRILKEIEKKYVNGSGNDGIVG